MDAARTRKSIGSEWIAAGADTAEAISLGVSVTPPTPLTLTVLPHRVGCFQPGAVLS
ncbi:hypothetical protein GCM10009030_00040 [Haloarcula pellucida]|uniref:Uncharacterized protein n=1 Tax=Haloarcula pellucida TaxID=1427151 RepID=A0A830GHE1_9EURY|nr:hypothetical protein GCM10009030_00040 [Halomicroarcula pellucida]